MIISHEHKFIFVKTRKTAGSSIEHFLSKYLGPTDICTGSDVDGTPRLNAPHRKGHIHWRWIAKHYPTEWQTYYKFAVERNPWDKMISYYYWHTNGKVDFENFCLDNTKQYDCWFRYADDSVRVDQLMRYEDIHNEILHSPLPYNNEMLTTFKKSDTNRKPIAHTKSTRHAVSQAFKRVIKHFNYEFTQ